MYGNRDAKTSLQLQIASTLEREILSRQTKSPHAAHQPLGHVLRREGLISSYLKVEGSSLPGRYKSKERCTELAQDLAAQTNIFNVCPYLCVKSNEVQEKTETLFFHWSSKQHLQQEKKVLSRDRTIFIHTAGQPTHTPVSKP